MPTSTIDGTIETAKLKRKARKISIFDTIVIRQPDGTEATLKKMVTAEPVSSALQPGAQGRFYTYSAFDMKGIHGFRAADGRALHSFPANNENIMLFVLLISIAVFAGWYFIEERIALLPGALIILGTLGYFFYRKGRIDAAKQFEGDAGHQAG
jgi:hypothetical protein